LKLESSCNPQSKERKHMNNKDELSELSEPGRPTKYTPETVDRLLAALADGLTQKQACLACGIGESTLYGWKKEHLELVTQMAEAREQARQKALAKIKAAGESGDWRASAEFLKLSFPEYRQGNSINVSATANAQQGIVVTEEKRRELQEKLAQWQEERAAAEEAEIERRVQARLAGRDTKELPDPDTKELRDKS
jgi:hypothetical protein